MVFSSIPNWVGYSAGTVNLAYKSVFFDPQDYSVHMSMIRAGMQGDWFINSALQPNLPCKSCPVKPALDSPAIIDYLLYPVISPCTNQR